MGSSSQECHWKCSCFPRMMLLTLFWWSPPSQWQPSSHSIILLQLPSFYLFPSIKIPQLFSSLGTSATQQLSLTTILCNLLYSPGIQSHSQMFPRRLHFLLYLSSSFLLSLPGPSTLCSWGGWNITINKGNNHTEIKITDVTFLNCHWLTYVFIFFDLSTGLGFRRFSQRSSWRHSSRMTLSSCQTQGFCPTAL